MMRLGTILDYAFVGPRQSDDAGAVPEQAVHAHGTDMVRITRYCGMVHPIFQVLKPPGGRVDRPLAARDERASQHDYR